MDLLMTYERNRYELCQVSGSDIVVAKKISDYCKFNGLRVHTFTLLKKGKNWRKPPIYQVLFEKIEKE